MNLREAVKDLLDYETTGAPDYLDWDAKFEALRTALEADTERVMAEIWQPVAALEAEPSKTVECITCGAEVVRVPGKYDQTALELCETCGWKTRIPGDCCLNCERSKPSEEPVAWAYKPCVGDGPMERRLTFVNPAEWGTTLGIEITPLYAHPPREYTPLTDEEIRKLVFPYLDCGPTDGVYLDGVGLLTLLRAIEAEVLRRMK